MNNCYSDKDFPDPGMALAVPAPEEKDPAKRLALAIVSKARLVAVFDQASLEEANGDLRLIKQARKKFDDEFDPGIARWNAGHKAAVADKKKWTDPLDEAEKNYYKPKIAAYLRAEDDKRREAERAAERARAEAAKEADDTADVAHELIKQGKADEAKELVEMQADRIEKIQATAPIVPEKPVANGSSLTKRWTWDRASVDMSLVPREFLKVDEAKVTRYVQNMKWDAKIAGIRIYAVDDVTTRI